MIALIQMLSTQFWKRILALQCSDIAAKCAGGCVANHARTIIEQVCQYGNRLKGAVGMQNHSARTVAGMTGSDARVVTVVLKTLGPQNLVLRCVGG